MRSVSQLIAQLVADFHKSPYEINNGECEEFAGELQSLLRTEGYQGVEEECSEYHAPFGTLPGHMWVKVDGRHYDAECPNGVKRWNQLPIFAKASK